MKHSAYIGSLLSMVLAAGCAPGDGADGGQSGAPAVSQVTAVERMMAAMDTTLRRADGASADSLALLLPAHRQAVANLIAEMNTEMRGMNMMGDAAWTAAIDSLRQDLVALPEMGRDELARVMPPHRSRITRLMEMHRGMMRGMKM